MKYKDHIFERDEEGRIIVDRFYDDIKKEVEVRGKREKEWLIFEDVKVLIKKIGYLTFEDYAELLAEELYKQMGIPAAEYDLAIIKGEKAVLSKNFLGEDDTFISGNIFIRENVSSMGLEKFGIEEIKEKQLNNVVVIEKILKGLLPEPVCKKELKKLYRIFGIYCMTLQGDIHWRNWAMLYNPKMQNFYRLCPLYDGSGMCRFTRGRNKLYGIYKGYVGMRDEDRQREYVEDLMFDKKFDRDSIMKYSSDSPSYMGVTKFMEAFKRNPNAFTEASRDLLLLDPELAVANVEKKINAKVPKLVNDWFVMVINRNKTFLANELVAYYTRSNDEDKNSDNGVTQRSIKYEHKRK